MICSSRLHAVFLRFLLFLQTLANHLLHVCPVCLFIMTACHSPPFSWCSSHTGFFLCLTLTKLFCLKVFSVLFPLHRICLPKLLTWQAPSQYSDLSPNVLREAFPEFSGWSSLLSCHKDINHRSSWALLCASNSLENLLKTQIAVSEFLIQ